MYMIKYTFSLKESLFVYVYLHVHGHGIIHAAISLQCGYDLLILKLHTFLAMLQFILSMENTFIIRINILMKWLYCSVLIFLNKDRYLCSLIIQRISSRVIVHNLFVIFKHFIQIYRFLILLCAQKLRKKNRKDIYINMFQNFVNFYHWRK